MKKMHCIFLSLAANISMDNSTVPTVMKQVFNEKLTCEKEYWDEITEFAVKHGCNSVLIDLGDGVKYKSHPEIAVEGAWTPEYLKEELKRLRSLGLTPYPKLNFSAGHDAWLGIYSRMVSTPEYYKVCKDLIDEVIDIFDTPEFFHLGLDEEDALNQQKLWFVCFRQHDLIWHDLKFFFDTVKAKGVRPWIWYDYFITHPKEFLETVPKDTLVSPWYYGYLYGDCSAPLPDSPDQIAKRESFRKLSEAGYELAPTGSNWAGIYNFDHIIRFSEEHIVPDKYKGLVITAWGGAPCEKNIYRTMDAIIKAKYAKIENGIEY